MDFEEEKLICRLCLSSCEFLIHIFEETDANGELVSKIIAELLQIVVSEDDELPSTICRNCLGKLKEFSDYKRSCISSSIVLREALTWRRSMLMGLLAENCNCGLPSKEDYLGNEGDEFEDGLVPKEEDTSGSDLISDITLEMQPCPEIVTNSTKETDETDVENSTLEMVSFQSSREGANGDVRCHGEFSSGNVSCHDLNNSEIAVGMETNPDVVTKDTEDRGRKGLKETKKGSAQKMSLKAKTAKKKKDGVVDGPVPEGAENQENAFNEAATMVELRGNNQSTSLTLGYPVVKLERIVDPGPSRKHARRRSSERESSCQSRKKVNETPVPNPVLVAVSRRRKCYACQRLFETRKGLSIHMTKVHFIPL